MELDAGLLGLLLPAVDATAAAALPFRSVLPLPLKLRLLALALRVASSLLSLLLLLRKLKVPNFFRFVEGEASGVSATA